MILLSFILVLPVVLAVEEVFDGGSCGASSIPYKISLDEKGRPELSCATPKCFGDDYTLGVDLNRQKRYVARDMRVLCDGYAESICDSSIQWTGGLLEVNNGTHRTLKTQCCTYQGMMEASQLKTVFLDYGQLYTGGLYKKGETVGGFDLIKEVRKKVDQDNKVQYIITVSRLPCIIDDEFSTDVTNLGDYQKSPGLSRSKRRLADKKGSTSEYDDEDESTYPRRRTYRRRPQNFRRRPLYRRPIDDYYYYDEDYDTVRRPIRGRGGRPQAAIVDNRLWPVSYGNARPKQLADATYNAGPAVYAGENQIAIDEPQTNVITPNYNPEPLPPPNTNMISSQIAPASSYSASYPAPAASQQLYPIPPVDNSYPPPPQSNSYAFQPAYPAPQSFPAYPAPAPSYPASSYSGYSGYNGGGGLNTVFSRMQCFSGDMMVETPTGSKSMEELKVGDLVLSIDESMVTFAPVIMFLHNLPTEQAEFVKLTTESGSSVKLTDNHLIYITKCGNREHLQLVPAKDVVTGDCIQIVNNNKDFFQQKVSNISTITENGIYAPLTSSGDIIVNGVLASCHSNLRLKTLQQTFFSVYRSVSNTYKTYFPQSDYTQDLPMGVSYLTSVIDLFVPKSFLV